MSLEVNIKKRLGDFYLNIQLTNSDKYLGILGASGCGKSILLRCIAGIDSPDEGVIVLNGRVLYDSKNKTNLSPQNRRIGYLFQNYALFPNMTVIKNIGITKAPENRIKELIRKLQLEGLENRYPSQLSGGQQQRVALARILAYEPCMILLDEPFSAIDCYLREQLQEDMKEILSEYQGAIILVSHNRSEILNLTKKLAVMKQGEIVLYDNTNAIFTNPRVLEAARLTGYKKITSAIYVDDYHMFVPEWNKTFETKGVVASSSCYVGVPSHIGKNESDSLLSDCIFFGQ